MRRNLSLLLLCVVLLVTSRATFADGLSQMLPVPIPATMGGTGTSATPTNGQIPIGSTATGKATYGTITAGTNITVTNGAGTIQIDATGGSSTLLHTKTTVPSAQILTYGSSPAVVMSAPGTGKTYHVVSWSAHTNYNSKTYTTSSPPILIYANKSGNASQQIPQTMLTTSGSQIAQGEGLTNDNHTVAQFTNQGISLSNLSGVNPTNGDSDVVVDVFYTILE